MKKAFKLVALIVMVAMIAAMAIAPASADAIPNTATSPDGLVEIGFFNFEDGRGTHLEIRLKRAPAGFGIAMAQTLSGIGRLMGTALNEDYFAGQAAGGEEAGRWLFGGAVTANHGYPVDGSAFAGRATVQGTGTITFGNGDFAVLWSETESTVWDITGLVLSNEAPPTPTTTRTPPPPPPPPTSPVVTTAPPATTPAATTTGNRRSNWTPHITTTAAPGATGVPKGGVALAIIPTIIAAGAAIVASKKRK